MQTSFAHLSWPRRRLSDAYSRFVTAQVRRARTEPDFAAQLEARWQAAGDRAGSSTTPTGLTLPRHALPPLDEPGAIARHLFEKVCPASSRSSTPLR